MIKKTITPLAMSIMLVSASAQANIFEDIIDEIEDHIIDPVKDNFLEPIQDFFKGVIDIADDGGRVPNSPDLKSFQESWEFKAFTLQRDLYRYYPRSNRYVTRTHNSFNTDMYREKDGSIAYLDPQHSLTLTGQLDLGIRKLSLDVHYEHGNAILCHWGGPSELERFFCNKDDRKFKDAIDEVVTWMRRPENKTQNVEIGIHDETGGSVTAYRQMSKALAPYEELLVSAGKGCSSTYNGGINLEQQAALGRRLLIGGFKNTLCDGNHSSKRELANYVTKLSDRNDAYLHVNNTLTGGGASGLSSIVWSGDWLRYPECRIGNFGPENFQYGAPTVSEDRTAFAILSGQKDHRHSQEDVRDLVNCGVNVTFDDLSPGDERFDDYIWSWSRNEPNNAGSGEHCAELGSKFNDAGCAKVRPYLCQDKQDPALWQLTQTTGQWADGFTACETEFGENFRFSVPKDGYERLVAMEVRNQQSVAKAWVNYSDLHKEGDWQPMDHPTIYWQWKEAELWDSGVKPNTSSYDCAVLKSSTALIIQNACHSLKPAVCYMDDGTAHGPGQWQITATSQSWANSEQACRDISGRFMMPADTAALASINPNDNAWINYSDIANEGTWQASLFNLNSIRPSQQGDYIGPVGLDGFSRLRSDIGKCIGVDGGDTHVVKGRRVQQQTCHHTTKSKHQLWKLYPDQTIRPFLNKNLCLFTGSNEENTPISLWNCYNNDTRTQWKIGLYNVIEHIDSGKIVEFDGVHKSGSRNAQLETNESLPWQRFHWDGMDKFITLQNHYSWRCLGIDSGDAQQGNNIHQWGCNANGGQQWYYDPEVKRFESRRNRDFCLHHKNSEHKGNVFVSRCNENGEHQTFDLDGELNGLFIRNADAPSIVLDSYDHDDGDQIDARSFHGNSDQVWRVYHEKFYE